MSTFLSIGVHIRIWLDGLSLPGLRSKTVLYDKKNMGMGWQYRYQHEFIIMTVKGTKNVRRIRTRNQTDIWQIPRIPGNKTIHPTEKPIDMKKRIIENSSEEGE